MSNFTEREQKLMAAACQSFEGEPKLDMNKFAERSGLAVGSARNAWAGLKKKLYAIDNATVKGVGKTPAKSTGKKRPPPVVLPANGGDSDDEEVFTPSKKPKTPKSAAKGKGKTVVKAPKSEDEDEDEEDGFVKVKEEVVDDEDDQEV